MDGMYPLLGLVLAKEIQHDGAESDPAHAVQPIGALGAVARARPTCRTGAGLHIRASWLALVRKGVRARRAARRCSAAPRRSRWISLASTRPISGYIPSISSNSSVVTDVTSMTVTVLSRNQ